VDEAVNPAAEDDLSALIRERVPADLFALLCRIRDLGEELQLRVFLVGGPVRDLLLGRSNEDLDIVVQGDGAALAAALAGADGGLVTYPQFGTSTVTLAGGHRVDVATARSESYRASAALPDVTPGTIDDDLRRRDFTINAMAVSLQRDSFGRLFDPTGGRADLAAKCIRVIHDGSFIDDPTRILRAIRFEQRFGFHLDAPTQALLAQSLQEGLLDRLSAHRLREEFFRAFGEADPMAVLRRLDEVGILAAIDPALAVTADTGAACARLPGLLARVGDCLLPGERRPDRALVYLLVLSAPSDESAADRLGQRLDLTPRGCHALKAAAEATPVAARLRDPAPLANSALVDLLERLPTEARCALGAVDDLTVDRVMEYLCRLRRVQPSITGEDLRARGFAPGPAFGEALAAVRRAKLDGLVSTQTDELDLAQTVIRRGRMGT
jgi:tRNA nucleotidyltransferase (CCA-adding enzyme)